MRRTALLAALLVALVALEVTLLLRPPRTVGPASLEDSRAPALPVAQPEQPADILLVTVDTLRPDHLGLYGYERDTSPVVDALFADGQVFDNAYTTQANTAPAVVSMLSGLYPSGHRVRLLYQRIPGDVYTLPDHLRAGGYQTAAVVSNIVLTEEALGLSTRFDHYDDFVDTREMNRDVYQRLASATTDAALHWLSDVRTPDRPHLLWVHYMDPHAPYNPPAERPRDFDHAGSRPFDLERMQEYARIPGVTDGLEYVDRYDEEIAYTDAEIGRLVAEYDALGLLDGAIVVFTSDHGETMMEHEQYFNHGYHVWEPIARIPLAIRWPGRTGERVQAGVSLADVTPTLLDAVGLPVPDGLDGRPLHQRGAADPLSVEASGFAEPHIRALVAHDDKWFAILAPDGPLTDRWYVDLEADPGEVERGEWFGHTAEATLQRWIEEDPDPAAQPVHMMPGEVLTEGKVAPGRTADELSALRALGYVE